MIAMVEIFGHSDLNFENIQMHVEFDETACLNFAQFGVR